MPASLIPRDLEAAIAGGQSPDNTVRDRSEQFILQKIDEDPGRGCTLLTEFALQDEIAIEHRLYSLLTLRKLVTMYWSAGFESYRGPPGIGENNKPFIRDALLKLGLDDAQNARIVASSSYCIVQIAAVDFPDAWPELLTTVFESIVNKQSLSALRLLNEIFDDIVSEEMFFQGGVGWQTIQLATKMLKSPKFSVPAKIAAGKLYGVCLGQLQLPTATATKELKDAVSSHLQETLVMLLEAIKSYSSFDSSDLNILKLLRVMTQCVNKITTSFSKSIVSPSLKNDIKVLVVKNLSNISYIRQKLKFTHESDEFTAVDELGCELLQGLDSIRDLELDEAQMFVVVKALVICSALIDEDEENWEADFNTFVTLEEGLSNVYRMRNASEEFLQDASPQLCELIMNALLSHFSEFIAEDWKLGEAVLVLLRWLCENVELSKISNTPQFCELITFLNDSIAAPQSGLHAPFLARMVIVAPKILRETEGNLPNWANAVKSFVESSVALALRSNDKLLKVAFLKGFCEYAQFSNLHDILGNLCFQLRESTCHIIEEISADSEEDTISVLLQALTAVASVKLEDDRNNSFYHSSLKLLLHISAKNPSNVEVVLEAEDCLSSIIKRVATSTYIGYAETCMPLIVGSLNQLMKDRSDYSPNACLSLELLKVFMKSKPSDGPIPSAISDFVLKPLNEILVNSTDDAITQLSSDCLVFLVHNTSAEDLEPQLPLIISTLEKLLSDQTTDSGAMNVGPLVLVTIKKFSQQLHDLFPVIMEAATKKFVAAENISTSENLLSLFCYLTTKSPQDVINFLSSFSVRTEGEDALSVVLPKWVDAFEVVRGNKRIIENIKALCTLFFQQDRRVSEVQVRGDAIPFESDLIVTRSMAKSMPQKYEMVTFYEKVTRLFVCELEFQSKQSDVSKYVPHDVEKFDDNDGEDDWEDVDSVLEFERLQGHLDDDSGDESEGWDSNDDDSASDLEDEDLDQEEGAEKGLTAREVLVKFFRDAASQNVNNFRAIYERLPDHEKKVLSENLI
ncbi:LAFA_0D00650g1_1 [Lachancea sp. 'fantastica']|nr:LAFA_0D00650g1_1 [Lachancea sp. 'fantastica']